MSAPRRAQAISITRAGLTNPNAMYGGRDPAGMMDERAGGNVRRAIGASGAWHACRRTKNLRDAPRPRKPGTVDDGPLNIRPLPGNAPLRTDP